MISAQLKAAADVGERALWTLIQAGVGEALVLALGLPQLWVVPIAAALAAVKSALAVKFSATGTASTLPPALDPAATP